MKINTKLQYETLGPMMPLNFVGEVASGVSGTRPGCVNPFEWSADSEKGGYQC
jgi:hypothetical protein